ncbi:calcium uniporter protein 2, mitochondrial-like isoform X2 [Actinidia eriantha]|uniref:calcium uniporter protein 2, mitochondrial-like isoform X2 n=1 Tax=Actinidia eriantha TaxID=165200 RepID=UPI00258F39EB|nr:calcium uniporter protein 2, mitochondrial-like isoform X2 [Actinidia eriantha]
MAFRRTLAQRLFNVSKKSNTILANCRISSPSSAVPRPAKLAPDPGDDGVFRRFLQWRPIYQSAATSPEIRSLPRGEKLMEKLRGINIAGDRIRLDGLTPPPPPIEQETAAATEGIFTVADARKLLRVSQLEVVKSKLRQIAKDHVPFAEFVEICSDGCSNGEEGLELAKMLDQSGIVIVLGNIVFLRPEQVVKVIQGLMPAPVDDHSLKELEAMEKKKTVIDQKAESLVRRELWCGLGYLVIQTVAFMRLTFWELTWDVMEPICFYVTSLYFMGSFAFFLRTSKEPSFEGFFQSRFTSKQKRLMKIHNFDVGRYNELRRAYYPCPPSTPER